ncbi:hypothetical protein GRI33_06305 [Brucella sp. BO3]|uniref:hypothetical protein n=1 Tax=unclassified Brucella TaxID=2632610 RepID=UPI00084FB628|nr:MULTISPECIES: hypothetical protein [unclassified Brucella]OEI83730.1 hypothetical protein BA060_07055 [Brucella sp. B13-0095]QMV26561.1 hypothetical protein GRI33_06305 [Brucella sp. BO3]
MNAILTTNDIVVHDDEPTVEDLKLAELLGFDRVRNIRNLIQRNMDELVRYGEVCSMVKQTSEKGGRPGTTYWLNEAQALLISIKSETPMAADVREQLIRIFMAWRRGELAAENLTPMHRPVEDTPASLMRYSLDVVREARLLYGASRARALWETLPGLPPVPRAPSILQATATDVPAQSIECLHHLLEYPVPGDPDMRSVAELLAAQKNSAWLADKTAWLAIEEIGIKQMSDGVWLAPAHPGMRALWEDTRWRDGLWVSLLKRLPGVTGGHERQRIGGYQCRPIWLPKSVIGGE